MTLIGHEQDAYVLNVVAKANVEDDGLLAEI